MLSDDLVNQDQALSDARARHHQKVHFKRVNWPINYFAFKHDIHFFIFLRYTPIGRGIKKRLRFQNNCVLFFMNHSKHIKF